MSYVQVCMVLTPQQASKLHAGKIAQISKDQLQLGVDSVLYLHPANAKKVERARKALKGLRLQMTEDEVTANGGGEGLKELVQGVKRAGRWVKDKIIDTPTYQTHIKPLVRRGVDLGIKSLSPYAGPLTGVVQRAADEVGKQTGAYGLRGRRPKTGTQSGRSMIHWQSGDELDHGMPTGANQHLLGSYSAAMWPVMAQLPSIGNAQPAEIPFPRGHLSTGQDSAPGRDSRQQSDRDPTNGGIRRKGTRMIKQGGMVSLRGGSFLPSGYP